MSDSEVEEVFTNNKKMSIGKSKSSVNIQKKRNKYIHSDNESLNEEELVGNGTTDKCLNTTETDIRLSGVGVLVRTRTILQ